MSVTISSYPQPEVEWNLKNGALILKPDMTSDDGNYLSRDLVNYHLPVNPGKYSAELVKTVGENQYLINLIIRDVSQADGELENFLRVTVKERDFTVPIILETQREWGEGEVTLNILREGFIYKSSPILELWAFWHF